MNTAENAIDLLVIEPSLDATEGYISALRNAGLAIHPTHITREAELADALDTAALDLILCSAETEQNGFQSFIDRCLESRSDVPLIIIYQDQEPEILLQAMQDGARDVVSRDDPLHLQLVVKREFGDLLLRRELENVKGRMSETETRCTTLIENSRDAIAYIHEGMHIRANPVYLNMFGYLELDDIEGLPILDMIDPEDAGKFKKFLRTQGSEQTELEVRCQNKEGESFDAILEFSPASIDGEPCTQIIIRNNTIGSDLEEKLLQISNSDPQTGLANRPYFMEQLEETSAKQGDIEGNYWLFYLVIDSFHQIRNSMGLAPSDTLLKELARTLEQTIDENALLARFGDHTFTLLNAIASRAEAESLAERLCSSIERHKFRSGSESAEPTCSIGLACLNESVPNSQEFINHAYHACEAARSEGGNRTSVYDDQEMHPSFGEEINEEELNELIEKALEDDRFKLVYQPIVSLQGDSRETYAVLTRLMDKDNEEIPPSQFMGSADQAGQMAAIDRWVINHAIGELAEQRKEGRKVSFFINLSAAALEDENLLLWICDSLRDHHAKGAWLAFQIHLMDLMNHLQRATKLIEGLKKIKCEIAIDHYGSISNSKKVLEQLPIDYVKFGSSLIEQLSTQQEKQDLLSELNREAQSQDVKTIAMGVEDANSLALLWTVGVNYIQGYFLQEPSDDISTAFSEKGTSL